MQKHGHKTKLVVKGFRYTAFLRGVEMWTLNRGIIFELGFVPARVACLTLGLVGKDDLNNLDEMCYMFESGSRPAGTHYRAWPCRHRAAGNPADPRLEPAGPGVCARLPAHAQRAGLLRAAAQESRDAQDVPARAAVHKRVLGGR